jgi:hypothetical protein
MQGFPSAVSFCRRWSDTVFKKSWGVYDSLGTLFGGLCPLIAKLVPEWESAMNHLVWQIPLCALGGLLVVRIIAAPYLLDRELCNEIKILNESHKKEIEGKVKEIEKLNVDVSNLPRPKVYLERKTLPQVLPGVGTEAFFLTNSGHADAFNVAVTFKDSGGFSALQKDSVNKIAVGHSELFLCYPMKVDDKHVHQYLGRTRPADLDVLFEAMEKDDTYPSIELSIAYKDFEMREYTDNFLVSVGDTFGLSNSIMIQKI